MNSHQRRQSLVNVAFLYTLLLLASLFWYNNQQQSSVHLAVAKGKQLYDMSFMAGRPLNGEILTEMAMDDSEFAKMLAGKDFGFVNALKLSYGEADQWQDEGCHEQDCAHLIFYNYTDGGTVNAILNLDTSKIISRWAEPSSRPNGSSYILLKAMEIAGADPEVRAILGDIGKPDPAMIPMSGWLMDDDCRDDWCVDLTYHDPGGSGRILHIFVNMEQNKVARTFFSRGRADRSLGKPLSQRNAFTDACKEQYGWNVCWEMTAHDGINFRDATFNNRAIFSSVKITQVEAWYPSWPGGYRDEIGFAASVPPFGDTNITDFGDGFEVSQLFTEFTHWPNCICCYRYEEIIRFYANGGMEFEFVSHGPGCDEIPIYRPFWRIDLNLDGPENDQVWVWEDTAWVEVEQETELFPFVSDLSPDGQKLATFDGDISYRWKMVPTDPLGRDESRFFILQKNELEGEGPVLTGPGDTFQPPRQWVNGDPASGNDIVLWYVPILKQLKDGPWWCMPDPEPDFTPCEAILRVVPAGELRQPTAEELAQATPTSTVTPLPSPTQPSEGTPIPTIPPTTTPTPRPLEGEDAITVIESAGCVSCHAIGNLGERRKVGPDLSNIGNLASERIPGMSAEDYLRESIIDPNDFIAPNCPNGTCFPNIMPADYGNRLSSQQVDLVVAYLLTQKDASRSIIGQQATPFPKAFPAPKRVGRGSGDNMSNLAIQIILLSMVFLLTVFRLIKQPPK